MHNVESMLVEKNYSKCPLKKRPVNFSFEETAKLTTIGDDSSAATKKGRSLAADGRVLFAAEPCADEPQNLSLKKDSHARSRSRRCSRSSSSASMRSSEELINVNDCCEDEGVDVDHMDYEDDDEPEEDEIIDCVEIDEDEEDTKRGIMSNTTMPPTTTPVCTQAAALAAAAAVAAASGAAVVVPTPTYPKYGLQPWSFHMSPYTAEFYRTINNPHLAQQISPLRGDLLSPNSPADSIGSLSPPHYLHGRANSVSPPMRAEIIRPIGVRQLPQSPQQQHHQQQHRYIPPYALTAYHQHQPHPHPHQHHHQQQQQQQQQHHHLQQQQHPHHPHHAALPLGATAYAPHPPHPHLAPISPAYSDSSYYSMRSITPESSCSPAPEDLSLKHVSGLSKSTTQSMLIKTEALDISAKMPFGRDIMLSAGCSGSAPPSIGSSSIGGSTPPTTPSTKKDKHGPPRYQCPDCQKSYSTFSGLTKHQQFHCPAAEGNQVKKSFSCKDCDKTYVSLGALKMHIRTHTLPCKCNICGKAFSRPWLLQGHIRTHTGEKPFSCQHCHRAFADRSNLRAHLQTHSDIKKYSCTSCSKTFSRMSLLTKHSEGGCPNGSATGGTGTPTSPLDSPGKMPTNSSEAANNSSFPLFAEQ